MWTIPRCYRAVCYHRCFHSQLGVWLHCYHETSDSCGCLANPLVDKGEVVSDGGANRKWTDWRHRVHSRRWCWRVVSVNPVPERSPSLDWWSAQSPCKPIKMLHQCLQLWLAAIATLAGYGMQLLHQLQKSMSPFWASPTFVLAVRWARLKSLLSDQRPVSRNSIKHFGTKYH